MNSNHPIYHSIRTALLVAVAPFALHAKESVSPKTTDPAGVKTYLVASLERINAAADSLVANAAKYAALVEKSGGTLQTVAAKEPGTVSKLLSAMQDDYKSIDSYGYETIEGIVAGVEKFAAYDIYLDAGVPASQGPEDVAPVVLTLTNGTKIDHEGAVFTWILEPALWGGDKRWIESVDIDGDGKVAARESLPKPEVLTVVALDVQTKISALLADAKAWTPQPEDCFSAMITMTPTFSEYFEDWKESRYGAESSGKFFAVSRVSDMRGIMLSCSVLYSAVDAAVAGKDPELAGAIRTGFREILSFIDEIEARERRGDLKPAEIDEMARQAKTRTDKLVPQIEQASALFSGKA